MFSDPERYPSLGTLSVTGLTAVASRESPGVARLERTRNLELETRDFFWLGTHVTSLSYLLLQFSTVPTVADLVRLEGTKESQAAEWI